MCRDVGGFGPGQLGPEATAGVSPPAGRSSRVSDAVADKFEQRARAVGLSEDVTYYFPTYGGWHTLLRETRVASVLMLWPPQGQRCKDGAVPYSVLGVQGLEGARSQTR